MQLIRLLDALPQKTVIGRSDKIVGNIVHDSRLVTPGDIFVALREPTGRDGHQYIHEAIAQGASVVVQEAGGFVKDTTSVVIVPDTSRALGYMAAAYFGNPANEMSVIGITGTNGKTTVSLLIEAILQECGYSVGGLGTLGSRFEGKVLDPTLNHTTPYPMELHRTIRKIRERGGAFIVMEVSSHSLVWERLTELNFNTCVFTNLSRDHLDTHKTFEAYREAKMLLFSDYLLKNGQAVLNLCDPAFPYFKKASPSKVCSFGLEKKADVHTVGPVKFSKNRTTFTAQVKDNNPFPLFLNLLGRFNVYNALAAISVGLEYGADYNIIQRAISKVKVPGRLEQVEGGQPFNVLVDFAHTPDALAAVLIACQEWTSGKLIVVFGCGGDRDSGKRPLMGHAASSNADVVIVTSDNPRTEPPDQIIKDIEPGLLPNTQTQIIQDRGEAILEALNQAQKDDTVLIAGRGEESYQIVGHSHIEFDDRIKTLEYLEAKYGK